jgi:hypothetical protein
LVGVGVVVKNSGLLKYTRSSAVHAVAVSPPPPVTAAPPPAPRPAPPPPEPSVVAAQPAPTVDATQSGSTTADATSATPKGKQDKKAKAHKKKH